MFRVSGEAKPAAVTLRAIFSGGRPGGFNGGFEDSVRDERGRPVPALWRIRPAQGSSFSRDGGVARTGRGSARIDGTGGGTVADAAFAIAPLDPAVSQGDRSTVTAFARAGAACGEVRVALRWFAADRRVVGGAQSAPLRCDAGWQKLRARGSAPAGAAFVGIYLRAAKTVGSAWFDDVRYACVRGRSRSTALE